MCVKIQPAVGSPGLMLTPRGRRGASAWGRELTPGPGGRPPPPPHGRARAPWCLPHGRRQAVGPSSPGHRAPLAPRPARSPRRPQTRPPPRAALHPQAAPCPELDRSGSCGRAVPPRLSPTELLSAAVLPAVLALDRLSSRAEGRQSPSRNRQRVFKDRSLESVFIRRTSSGRGVIEDDGAGAVRRLSPGDPAPPAGRRTPGPVSSRADGAGVTCDRETSSAAVTGIRWEFVASFHFLKTFPFDPLM